MGIPMAKIRRYVWSVSVHISVVYIYLIHWGQICRHFTDDIFEYIFLNENIWISIEIWLKFVPKVSINNIPTLVQTMVWHRPGEAIFWTNNG